MKSLHLLLPLPVRLEQALDSARKASPSLMAITRRGATLDAEQSLAGCCCRGFGIAKQQDWPIAPLTARSDGLEPGNAFWLRLDPAHLEVGMGGLMLRPAWELSLSREEARSLVASINDHWRAQGLEIHAPSPTRWYLSLPDTPDFTSTPLDQVVGEYLTPHLPRGRDANRLMTLVNEAQMLMHEHPVNQERESAGRLTLNGLWLWGGGALPTTATTATTLERVASDDAEVRAMARAAGLQPVPSPASLRDLGDPTRISNALASLAPGQEDFGLEDYLAKLERDWFKPLLRELAFGHIRRLRLDLLTRPSLSLSIGTAQAWRFWR